MTEQYPALRWQGDHLELLDQRCLPHEIRYLRLDTAGQVADAIRDMAVRGAPAIGIAAAYGAALAVLGAKSSPEGIAAAVEPQLDYLAQARPTAVNLFWALQRVRETLAEDSNNPAQSIADLAVSLHEQDIANNQSLGGMGASLLSSNSSVYTHCNAGALATGGYGTALGVIRAAHSQGKIKQVYAGETRPWMQGSRLTSWELQQAGIPVTLSTEGAAGSLMRRGLVDWVIVGSDRVASNGDVANKIGTYNLAVLARHHGVKFMVALPTSTIDMDAADGSAIPIEERAAEEITAFSGQQISPAGVGAINPAFDVTPAELVDALVTERGVLERPNRDSMAQMMELGNT